MGWTFIGNTIVNRRGGGSLSTYWTTREPSGIAVTITGATTATVTWTDSLVLGADGYKVYAGATLKNTVNVGVQAANVTGLTANTLYTFKVVAYKGTNESTGVTTNATTWTLGEAVIRTSNTVAWYDVMDLSTITKDGSDRVSAWADKLGSGNDIVQANGANQPLWSAGQILGDGIDEFMKDAFTWQTNVSFYAVMKPIIWSNYSTLVDGAGDNSFRVLHYNGSPNMNIRIGSYGSPIATTIGSFQVYSAIAKSGDQKTRINKGAVVSATVASTVAPNGLKLFTRGSEVDGFGNFAVAEIICRTGLDTDTDRDNIIDYLMAKYGL